MRRAIGALLAILAGCATVDADTAPTSAPTSAAPAAPIPLPELATDTVPIIVVPATATEPAVRVDPPDPPPTEAAPPPPPPSPGSSDFYGGRCVGWEALLGYMSPGWNVERMSRIMYRESRCEPAARNRSSSATGLLQVLASHCPWLAAQLDTWCTRDRLTDPVFNVYASARLWVEQGYSAWSTS